jgi:hypothetical protein
MERRVKAWPGRSHQARDQQQAKGKSIHGLRGLHSVTRLPLAGPRDQTLQWRASGSGRRLGSVQAVRRMRSSRLRFSAVWVGGVHVAHVEDRFESPA